MATALSVRVNPLTTPLTNQDRCDKCGAQAYVKAEFVAADLLFCGHHYRQNLIKIHQQAVSVQGELPSRSA